MARESNSASSGIGVGGALLVLFVGLKLCGIIDWSWWWVTAPVWMPLLLIVSCVLIGGVIYVAVALLKQRKARRA